MPLNVNLLDIPQANIFLLKTFLDLYSIFNYKFLKMKLPFHKIFQALLSETIHFVKHSFYLYFIKLIFYVIVNNNRLTISGDIVSSQHLTQNR